MQVELLRRAINGRKLSMAGKVTQSESVRVHPLLSNDADRKEGRCGKNRTRDLHAIQTSTTVADITILRSMDMINLLIAPDANMGPLDWIVHQLGGEFVSIGTPQPIESLSWKTIVSTLETSWQDQGCLSCVGACKETCLGIRTSNATPSRIKDILRRILMTGVLDEELECWHAAVTEFPPSVSYSLLTLLSNPESLESWRADRQVLFLRLETWPCLMKEEAKVPQLAYELIWDQ